MAGPQLLIDLRASIDKFERDMKAAGSAADRAVSDIERSFSRANPQINFDRLTRSAEDSGRTIGVSLGRGIAVGIAGIVGAIGSALALLDQLNGQMLDLQRNAERAGTTIEDFQRFLFAARSAGVGTNQAAKDLADMASRIEDLSRGESALSKFLDANNIKYKERGKVIIDTNEGLRIAADLISRARPGAQQEEVLRLFGLTREWLDALKEGPQRFDEIARRADEVGGVITKQTVEKAAEFKREWNQAANEWSTWLAAKVAGLLPAIDDLVNRMQKIGEAKAREAGGGLLGLVDQEINKLGRDVNKFLDDISNAKSAFDKMVTGLNETAGAGQQTQVVMQGLISIWAALTGQADQLTGAVTRAGSALSRMSLPDLSNLPGGGGPLGGADVPNPRPRPAGANRPTQFPERSSGGGGSGTDVFETEINRLRRHIAVMDADTASIGLNEAARARMRAEANLLQRAEEAGLPVNDALRERVRALGEEYERAAQRAELAKTIMSEFSAFGSALSNAFQEAVLQGKKLDEVLKNLANRLASRAFDRVFDILLRGLGGGLLSGFAGPGGGVLSGGLPLGLGGIGHNAEGVRNWRGGLTWVGEKGPELVNLPRGSDVIPSATSRQLAGGSTVLNYAPVIDARGATPDAIAALKQELARDRQLFQSRMVASIVDAKRRSVRF